MQPRHSDQLMLRLDELYQKGVAYISWAELYQWYDIQKIQKGPWRDIRQKWCNPLSEMNEAHQEPQVAYLEYGASLYLADSQQSLRALAK